MGDFVKLILSHQSARHEILVDADKEIIHLMEKLEEITEIPTENMKVIANGKTISAQPNISITAAGLKSGNKLMLLGKKVNSAEETFLSSLKPIRIDFEKKVIKLDQSAASVENYEKGFVQEKKQIDKDIISVTEFFMKTLEKLDGMTIGQEFKVAREKRKSLVKEIQKQLDRADILRNRLSFSPTGKLK